MLFRSGRVVAGNGFEGGDENLRDGTEADAADQKATGFRTAAGKGLVGFRDVPGDAVNETSGNGDESRTVV